MFVMVGDARFLGSGTETTSLYLQYIIRKRDQRTALHNNYTLSDQVHCKQHALYKNNSTFWDLLKAQQRSVERETRTTRNKIKEKSYDNDNDDLKKNKRKR